MNERGVALPMALIVMALLLALVVAFASLGKSEPIIANNHATSAQARAFAESGLERAIWALSPTSGPVLTPALTPPVPPEYTGTTFEQQSALGGYIVNLAQVPLPGGGPDPNRMRVTSTGYVPNNTNWRARKLVTAVITHVGLPGDPDCALCVGGESPLGTTGQIQISGNAFISSSTSHGATYCAGQKTPSSGAMATGAVDTGGSATVYGPTGTDTGSSSGAPVSNFQPFTLTDTDIAVLKQLAKQQGTYYQGSKTWNTTPPPQGLVFVDTLSGNPFTNNTPDSDAASVTLNGNFTWSGWMIVAGSMKIMGNPTINGLVYAQNDVDVHGAATINGAVVSTNRKDASSTNIDSQDIGTAQIYYNCPDVRTGGGTLPPNWFVQPGTYAEISS